MKPFNALWKTIIYALCFYSKEGIISIIRLSKAESNWSFVVKYGKEEKSNVTK